MGERYYESAGGVILDDEGRVLLLERHVPREEGSRHEIRLPKGHIDEGETPEEAALRECCEESGYCHLEIVGSLGTHMVRFVFRNRRVRRLEYYFLMRLTNDAHQAPDVDPESEEALFEVRWAETLDEAERLLTYPGEKRFARRAATLLADDQSITS